MSLNNLKQEPLIGFVGLGSIGLPMAVNLVSSGFKLKVHTPSRTAEENIGLRDSIRCSSPLETAEDCDILFICVSDDKAVENVIFSKNGAYQALTNGSIIIDFSTISPNKVLQIRDRLNNKGIKYFDAPVTGGTEGAIKGTLTILIGSNKEDLLDIVPILNVIGENIFFFGEIGSGQKVKAINQILVAGSYIALAEAITFGQKNQLPMQEVISALGTGAANSWALENRSKNMLSDKYPLGFKIGLHHKDLNIALNMAEELGLKLPITNAVMKMETEMIEKGLSDLDISALKLAIDK